MITGLSLNVSTEGFYSVAPSGGVAGLTRHHHALLKVNFRNITPSCELSSKASDRSVKIKVKFAGQVGTSTIDMKTHLNLGRSNL